MKKLMMAAVAAVCCVAMADGPKDRGDRAGHPGMGQMAGMMGDPIVRMVSNPKVAEKLGLSEEQQKKIKEIQKSNRGGAKENQKKLREAMDKQMKLLKAEKIDEAAVMAAIDEVFEIRKDLAKAQTKQVIEVKALLTPEQVAKALESFKEMRKDRMNERKGKGKGPKAEGDKPVCEGEGCAKDAPAED